MDRNTAFERNRIGMIYLAICDDEPLHCSYTERKVSESFSDTLSIKTFHDGDKLIEVISSEGYSPDLAVLDIKMEGTDGIAVARKLNQLVPNCRIIFFTGYAEYASQAYLVDHVWLVLKEQSETYLIPALKRAIAERTRPEEPEILSFRCEGKTVAIPVEDILYIDRFARKARVFCRDGCYSVSASPSKLLEQEPGSRFVRCHQGYWVNLSHIKILDHSEFILDDGTRIPISRSYKNEARARFFDLYRPL